MMRALMALGVVGLLAIMAHADPCANATGTLCKKTQETADGTVIVTIQCKGNVGSGNSGPCTTTVSYTSGGTTVKASSTASGSGKSTTAGVTPPPTGTTMTATVSGGDCTSTQTDSKKVEDIPNC